VKRIKSILVTAAFSLIAAPAPAATFTFDTAPDLTSNFNLDVLPGDGGTHWEPGYIPFNGFPGSDGGLVMFDDYQVSHSIQFKAGPVTLNSFNISSQVFFNGGGVHHANMSQGDYRLRLYDENNQVLLEQVRTIAPGGAWETLTFNLANVSTIWIESTATAVDGTGEFGWGWWPALDSIAVNETSAVPIPGALALFPGVLAAMTLLARRRKKQAA
jgi:hypothetical protein